MFGQNTKRKPTMLSSPCFSYTFSVSLLEKAFEILYNFPSSESPYLNFHTEVSAFYTFGLLPPPPRKGRDSTAEAVRKVAKVVCPLFFLSPKSGVGRRRRKIAGRSCKLLRGDCSKKRKRKGPQSPLGVGRRLCFRNWRAAAWLVGADGQCRPNWFFLLPL